MDDGIKEDYYFYEWWQLKAPYSSEIDIFLSKNGLINWFMVLIQP